MKLKRPDAPPEMLVKAAHIKGLYDEGYTPREIAKACGITQEVVRIRLKWMKDHISNKAKGVQDLISSIQDERQESHYRTTKERSGNTCIDSERMRLALCAQRISIREAGRRLGVSHATIHYWLRNGSIPKGHLELLASVCGVCKEFLSCDHGSI